VASDIAFQRDDRVAVVTINRPSDQNHLTREVLLGLKEIVRGLAGDDETQAVVLTDAGSQFFSMGILSPVVRKSYSKEQVLELVRTANRAYESRRERVRRCIMHRPAGSCTGSSQVHDSTELLPLAPLPDSTILMPCLSPDSVNAASGFAWQGACRTTSRAWCA
jgi:hypothetical protein